MLKVDDALKDAHSQLLEKDKVNLFANYFNL